MIKTDYHDLADRYLVGSVNSPVRSFRQVNCSPLLVNKARGAWLRSIDNLKYIDFCQSWGASILGHAPKTIRKALRKSVRKGTSYGFTCQGEIDLAGLICQCMPAVEKIRFVNSGTEAVMSAVRLARAFTGKDIIIKFDGCYHGHSDGLLVAAGSGPAELNNPQSPGVLPEQTSCTISIPFNNKQAVEDVFKTFPGRIAAVLTEPVPANMGLILPKDAYLSFLREITTRHGALLIFDEVITGFRVGLGGAQGHFGIKPDLTCLGKIIGGGLPVGAFGGRRDIMDRLAPLGDVYQAGTLSGNPAAMKAGFSVLCRLVENPSLYNRLEQLGDELKKLYSSDPVPALTLVTFKSLFTFFCRQSPPGSFSAVRECDFTRFGRFYRYLLERKLLLPPSQYETGFLSLGHNKKHISALLTIIRNFGRFDG